MNDRSLAKTETFVELLKTAPIHIEPGHIFQQGLQACHIMAKQRQQWWAQVRESLGEKQRRVDTAHKTGSYCAIPDFGHTTSNTKTLLSLGFRGVPLQVKEGTPLRTYAQMSFDAMADYCLRLADQEGVTPENAAALRQLAVGAPRTMYEAMQMMSLYFYLHEFIAGTRVRTLGRLDEVFLPFYLADKAKGMTRQEAQTLWQAFLTELWLMKVPYDLPFCIGGTAEDGTETTNELSYLIVDAYHACNIHSPKIHVRVSDKTPTDFIKKVLTCIREGNSSFLFVNDAVGIKMMQKCGTTLEEARSFVPIGCYEPSVFDKELPCTGNGYINLPKALEFIFNDGCDLISGERLGVKVSGITDFDSFYEAVKTQIDAMLEECLSYVSIAEKHYMEAGPDPILSALLSPCAQSGVDVMAGGAKYNNSSMCIGSIATLVDAIAAVRYLVYEQKRMTLAELGEILLADWEGHESLRQELLHLPLKYGNNIAAVDDIAADLTRHCAERINGRPNGRGGIFKASNFTIDRCFRQGSKTMATPDGRKAGDPLSKNFSAVTSMDRKGLTALIQSASKLHADLFPNGTVLDFVLHPSAVAGEDGLDAFLSLIKVYFDKGGFAIQGNIFSAEQLKAAQANPEQYANLQVRVCGWNVFFVNLSKVEQDAFIRQAEGTMV